MFNAMMRKGLESVVTLFLATLIMFVLIRLAPGDPVDLLIGRSIALSNTEAYEEQAAELRSRIGLDHSVAEQYGLWMKQLLHLDLGTSIYTGRPVMKELLERLPATITISTAALLFQLFIGLVFGVLSALRAGKVEDQVLRFSCVMLASTPVFVIGLTSLSLFAVTYHAYEINSDASAERMWLPAITLGMIGSPQMIRMVRASMLTELGQLYISSAVARGLSTWIVLRHALRNAILPLVTLAGISLTSMVSGAVVIESIFSWPGVGKYALDSILLKDYPAIQGYALVMVAIVMVINMLTEVLYAYIDPRLRSRLRRGVVKHG